MNDDLFLSEEELTIATDEEVEAFARRLWCVYVLHAFRMGFSQEICRGINFDKIHTMTRESWRSVAREALKAVKK